jgi:spore maturation protein CgeB
MKIVIFGLTISSSWGNGHATLWRGLCRAWARFGHRIIFFERDVPYYAGHRDCHHVPGDGLVLYPDWESIRAEAARHLADCDVAMVTSYCPDALPATEQILASPAPLRVFYDLDTPVTLGQLEQGRSVGYIGPRGLQDFDLVLSFTGGEALRALREKLGARRVAPLYGSVDPDVHKPVQPTEHYRADLSYLGTYSEDRQETLERLFLEPARRLPDRRFLIGGAQYPNRFPWLDNIFFVRHLPPNEHAAFFSSSRLTLNVTRRAMADMGYCPSGRLFEAAACAAPLISDSWAGIESFFEPGREIIIADAPEDVIGALHRSDAELSLMAQAARERTLQEYTAERRAAEFERIVSSCMAGEFEAKPAERILAGSDSILTRA